MNAGLLFALSLPGLVCLLVVLAALEGFGRWLSGRSWLPWRRRKDGLAVTAAGVEELDAFFTAGRRVALESRASHSLMRDEEGDSAPPELRVDLDTGAVVITPPRDDQPGETTSRSFP